MSKYKMMSLFSGSGGFELAATLCGIEPVAASEVEPYPIAVTRSRFPSMKHLGSVTDINGAEIEPVDVITFGSPCFPAGTLVLTKSGYVPIEEIRVGDEVFTHKGNWKPVSAIGYKYSRTVRMMGNHYGIVATPNHPFYSAEQGRIWNGNSYSRILENVGEWTPAEKMQGKRWAVPHSFSGLEIPAIEMQSKKQNEPPAINADLMYIVGRWLGDGWLRDGQRPNRPKGQTWGQIFICANRNEADCLEKVIRKVFDGNSAVSRFSERTVEKFRISNQALCWWLKQHFGEKADGKTIPAWALCMRGDFRAALLSGYLDSDGYKCKENSWKATTVSKRLAHGIRLLGETLGYSCTVHYADVGETTTIEGREVNQKPQYQIVLRNEKRKTSIRYGLHNWYKCRIVTPYSDEQKVYNITVDDDHSYIVEGFVVHNCQDLSVAGKRAGLKHEANGDEETTRSGLFMEAVRIIKEMRAATNGVYPRFALWENVPGAFSSNKGEDFRIVLQELIQIVEPTAKVPPMPKGGWPYSDVYMGGGWSLAYRTFDAQYWGVPQRRRRIHLVADFTGECAGKVLFEREGVRGYFAACGETGQGTAADAERGVGADDCEGAVPYTLKIRGGVEVDSGGKAAGKGALIQKNKSATLGVTQDQYLFQPVIAVDQGGGKSGANFHHNLSPTLTCTHGGEPAVAYALEPGIAAREGGHIYEGVSGTLRANAGDNQMSVAYGVDVYNQAITGDKAKTLNSAASDADHVPCVMEAYGFCPETGGNDPSRSVAFQEELSPTLRAGNTPAIVYSIESHSADSGGNIPAVMGPVPIHDQATRFCGKRGDKADGKGNGLGVGNPSDPMNTLTSGDRHAVCYAETYQKVTGPLMANSHPGSYTGQDAYTDMLVVGKDTTCFRQGGFADYVEGEVGTLRAAGGDYGGGTENLLVQHRIHYIVRRLTPTECARLQGFADRWGEIDPKEDFTDEEYSFWLEVRKTFDSINGRAEKDYTKAQLLKWYNGLRTDSAEYKLWGNGIALPPAVYCMQGIVDALVNAINY